MGRANYAGRVLTARRGLAAAALAAIVTLAACGDGFRYPDALVGTGAEKATTSSASYGYVPRISDPLTYGQNAALPSGEAACRSALDQLGVRYTDLPPIDDGGVCRIDHPVSVSGFSGGIALKPAATLNCPMAETLARWVRNDLAPAARLRYLSGVSSIHQLSSYSCRTMNNVRGAKMSEHSKGNAIDIGSITLKNGDEIDVQRPSLFSFRQRSMLNTVRAEACDYFTTVLGPGDAYHGNHFHFDLMHRRGRRICE